MKFFYLENLTKQSTHEGYPWECPAPKVSEEIRNVKEERQRWYQNPQTKHQFYSVYEGVNPNARINTDTNPAAFTGGFLADLDFLRVHSREEVNAILDELLIQPNYLEKSLGYGWRFLWVFEKSVRWVTDKQLALATLERIKAKLGLDKIQALDQGSWETPHRYFCNGGQWEHLHSTPLLSSLVDVQAGKAAVELASKSKVGAIKLERVLELIKAKWPDFEWPEEFTLGSQGPSWWIEGSTSPKSAIVHADGMYTFSAHREKDKYFWNDILGAGTVEEDRMNRVIEACRDYYFDGKNYWGPRPRSEIYPGFRDYPKDAMVVKLRVEHGLSAKAPKGDDQSEIDLAFKYLVTEHMVDQAAPLLYRQTGLIDHDKKCYLNTTQVKPLQPADGPQTWGEKGNFPFISKMLELMFVHEPQLTHYNVNMAVFYQGALANKPVKGQSNFLAGGTGIGKTLWVHRGVGPLMGGVKDASSFLQGKDAFGGELFSVPVWAIDDQEMVSDLDTLKRFTSLIKKHSANVRFTLHEKYMKKIDVDWLGRIFTTCNLDAWSQTVMPAIEDGIADKVNFYKLTEKMPPGFFPSNVEEIIARELPYYAAYLRDLQIPDELKGDARYVIKPYQDPDLVANAYSNSGSTGIMENIYDFMVYYEGLHDERGRVWTGTASQLVSQFRANPTLEGFVRTMSVRQMTMHLKTLQGFTGPSPLKITSDKNSSNMLVWTIRIRRDENDKRNKQTS